MIEIYCMLTGSSMNSRAILIYPTYTMGNYENTVEGLEISRQEVLELLKKTNEHKTMEPDDLHQCISLIKVSVYTL